MSPSSSDSRKETSLARLSCVLNSSKVRQEEEEGKKKNEEPTRQAELIVAKKPFSGLLPEKQRGERASLPS